MKLGLNALTLDQKLLLSCLSITTLKSISKSLCLGHSLLLLWVWLVFQISRGKILCLLRFKKVKKTQTLSLLPKISVLLRNKLHTDPCFHCSSPPYTQHSFYLQQICISIYVIFKTAGENNYCTGLNIKIYSLEMLHSTTILQ